MTWRALESRRPIIGQALFEIPTKLQFTAIYNWSGNRTKLIIPRDIDLHQYLTIIR